MKTKLVLALVFLMITSQTGNCLQCYACFTLGESEVKPCITKAMQKCNPEDVCIKAVETRNSTGETVYYYMYRCDVNTSCEDNKPKDSSIGYECSTCNSDFCNYSPNMVPSQIYMLVLVAVVMCYYVCYYSYIL